MHDTKKHNLDEVIEKYGILQKCYSCFIMTHCFRVFMTQIIRLQFCVHEHMVASPPFCIVFVTISLHRGAPGATPSGP